MEFLLPYVTAIMDTNSPDAYPETKQKCDTFVKFCKNVSFIMLALIPSAVRKDRTRYEETDELRTSYAHRHQWSSSSLRSAAVGQIATLEQKETRASRIDLKPLLMQFNSHLSWKSQ